MVPRDSNHSRIWCLYIGEYLVFGSVEGPYYSKEGLTRAAIEVALFCLMRQYF